MDEEKYIYDVIDEIDAEEITTVLDYVLSRHAQLFPNWSLSVLSMNKREDRIQQIDEAIAFFEKLKENTSLWESKVIKG